MQKMNEIDTKPVCNVFQFHVSVPVRNKYTRHALTLTCSLTAPDTLMNEQHL